MKPIGNVAGKWAWEGVDPMERHLLFRTDDDRITIVPVINGKELPLKDGETTVLDGDDNTTSLFFGKLWESRDGTKFFRLESEFVSGGGMGTFVNASEFTVIDNNRMTHRLMGYRFDHEEEKWINFDKETVLNRIE